MTNELIISNTILPKIDANFEELKSSLILELQKYDFVVTQHLDNLISDRFTTYIRNTCSLKKI